MAKNTVGEWDTTASANTDIGGINIAEGCAAANINNAIRELMAQVAALDPVGNGGGMYTVTGTLDLSAATVTYPADSIGVDALASPTGIDTSIVTGTAGTASNLLWWDADGDAVDSGFTVLDEDDFASDSDTAVPTQQSTKSYIISRESQAVSGALSGSAVDVTGIPSGVSQIDVMFSGASLSGSDDIIVQFLVGGTPVSSGYVSTSHLSSAGTDSYSSSTGGFILRIQGAGAEIYGEAMLCHRGGNIWTETHSILTGTTATANGGGGISLAGEVDGVRITRSGTNTFDSGGYAVRWRY